MLPLYKCTQKDLIRKPIIIELILLMSDVDPSIPVLCLNCPDGVKPIKSMDIIGVFTDLELAERKFQSEQLKRKEEKRKRKEEKRRRKEEEKRRMDLERLVLQLQAAKV